MGTDSGADNVFRITKAANASYFYALPLGELAQLSGGRLAPVDSPSLGLAEAGVGAGIKDRLRGERAEVFCPNCAEKSTFMVIAGADLARCYLCNKLFLHAELGLDALGTKL